MKGRIPVRTLNTAEVRLLRKWCRFHLGLRSTPPTTPKVGNAIEIRELAKSFVFPVTAV